MAHLLRYISTPSPMTFHLNSLRGMVLQIPDTILPSTFISAICSLRKIQHRCHKTLVTTNINRCCWHLLLGPQNLLFDFWIRILCQNVYTRCKHGWFPNLGIEKAKSKWKWNNWQDRSHKTMWNVPQKEVKSHKLKREVQKQRSKLWKMINVQRSFKDRWSQVGDRRQMTENRKKSKWEKWNEKIWRLIKMHSF
jgi:hypothetical protein